MIRVRQVKVPILESDKLLSKIASKIRVDKSFILDFNIIKRSIDARDKSNILYVYEVDVSLANEDKVLKKNKSVDILKSPSLIQFIGFFPNLYGLLNKAVLPLLPYINAFEAGVIHTPSPGLG